MEIFPQYGLQINVDGKNGFTLIPTFSYFSWLKKNNRDYNPKFITSFTKIPINSQEISSWN